jgi:hypothetical protein
MVRSSINPSFKQAIRVAIHQPTSSQRLDADAAAVIAALTTAGQSVTAGQQSAINTFFVGGKTPGEAEWFSRVKRMYFFGWNNATASAIDWITRASGSFEGTVTHSAGSVAGNGTNGYFMPDEGGRFGDVGMTSSNAHISYTFVSAFTENKFAGLRGSGSERFRWNTGSDPKFQTTAVLFTDPGSKTTGVAMGVLSGAAAQQAYMRDSAGLESASNTNANPASYLNIRPFAMATNNNGTAADFSAQPIGGFGYGLSMTATQASAYTLARKTLWEALTGLSLP